MKIYAGIGSRETPRPILTLFNTIGEYLAREGYILRSGAAQGADSAFEMGCDKVQGLKEIYIPWPNFNNRFNRRIPDLVLKKEAFEIAQKFHPKWHVLSDAAKKLIARNTHQILGYDLNEPSNFVICYTDGGKGGGGTGQALRIAKHHKIPIWDVGKYNFTHNEKLFNHFKEFLNQINQ